MNNYGQIVLPKDTTDQNATGKITIPAGYVSSSLGKQGTK